MVIKEIHVSKTCLVFLPVLCLLLVCCDAAQPEGGSAAAGVESVLGDGNDGATAAGNGAESQESGDEKMTEGSGNEPQLATFGGGCFWCVEAVLEQLDGVLDASSGYMGGHVDNPTYEQVCGKQTGHIEVVQVKFDPAKVSYETLLKWFFKAHDPTTLDRQGGDKGPQYRSAIFFHSPEQEQAALTTIKKIDEGDVFPDKVVTEVRKAEKYWVAEPHHQDYYRLNKNRNPYCQAVITPKLDKLGLDK